MTELKRCPFCGGEARLIDDDWSYVICTKCGIHPYHKISILEAIEAWNNRWMIPCEKGETEGNWHTGTPTEEGWYVFQFHDSSEIWLSLEYLTVPAIAKMNEKKLFNNNLWQKIELYKEKQDGHTD